MEKLTLAEHHENIAKILKLIEKFTKKNIYTTKDIEKLEVLMNDDFAKI